MCKSEVYQEKKKKILTYVIMPSRDQVLLYIEDTK